MAARKQSNMVKQRYAGLVMDQRQSQGLAQQLVMHVEVQACKQFDKALSLCRQCAEFVKEKAA